MKVIRNMQDRFDALSPSTKAVVKGVGLAAVVGVAGVAGAQTTLAYGDIAQAGRTEVTTALTGGAPQIASLAGMVGGAGWILRKLFNI